MNASGAPVEPVDRPLRARSGLTRCRALGRAAADDPCTTRPAPAQAASLSADGVAAPGTDPPHADGW